MAITRPRTTEEKFMRLPNDGRKFELVDGEVEEVPTSFNHDRIVLHLARLIGPFADDYGYLAGSQAGFRMKDGNIRCPDLSFTRFEQLPEGEPPEGFLDFAPALCIEVISPTEEPADMRRKLEEYFASGAQEVWHLFPETRQVKVFTASIEAVTLEEDQELDGGDLLPGFRCRVVELFAVRKKPSA